MGEACRIHTKYVQTFGQETGGEETTCRTYA